MKGGVGRYTYNLVNALKKRNNIDIFIAMSNRKNKTTTTTTTTATSLSDSNSSSSFNNGIYYNIVNKGDKQNSDRLLNLIDELKPDIVNVQYERGIYEIDTTIRHMARRLIYGSTLD